jgi:trimeric autotransporter adhesin
VGSHTVLATYQGDSSFQQSSSSLTETIQLAPAATPTFSPAGGAYAGSQSVTISDQTSGATIYYTTNGATPTTSSTVYTGPIPVSATETIQALASASGYAPSAIASATFTIQEPMVTLSPGSLNFGSQTDGTSSQAQTVTVQNSGSASLSSITITLSESSASSSVGMISTNLAGISSHDYSATTTCGSTLAAGASCTVSVTFSPTTTGSLPGSLQISDNAAGSPQTVGLAGTGTAPVQGDFTVIASTSSATTTYGGSTQFQISVSALGGPYESLVSLSASGLPAGATASFSPSSVTPGSGTANSVLTIETASLNAANSRTAPLWPVSSPVLALLFFAIPRKLREQWSRRVILVVLMLVSISAAVVLIGCGGGFAVPQPTTTSTITIIAASGADVHTTTVQLTVK